MRPGTQAGRAGRPRRAACRDSSQAQSRRELLERAVDVGLPLADDPEERAVADELDARGLPAAGVERSQPRAGRRRPQHPAVELSARAAGRRGSAAGRAPCRAGRAGASLPPTAVGRTGGTGGSAATSRSTCRGRGAATARDVPAVRLGRRRPAPRHAPRRRGAAPARPARTDRLPAVRPSSGPSVVCAGDHPDAGQRQAELVGGDLRERGEDALAELDLADVDVDGPSATVDPACQPRVGRRRARAASAHGRLPAPASTASTIRRWAPHRHRLRSSASATRSASASGSSSQQRGRAHHDPGDAEAALRGLLVEDRLLHRVRLAVGRQPLDGRRPPCPRPTRRACRRTARTAPSTCDEAGAAQALPAAEPGADQARARRAARRAAGCPGRRRPRRRAVDGELERRSCA